jgi:hypothetical protein
MKKTITALCFTLALLLSACGSTTSAVAVDATTAPQNAAAASGSDSARLDTSFDGAATVEIQLLVGTLKLEGTDLAVTTGQAGVLLPLWQQIQTLAQSMLPAMGNPGEGRQAGTTPTVQSDGSAAQTQIDGVLDQIQGSMTGAQIQAITGMQITQDSATAAMQELGITMFGFGGQPGADGTQPAEGGQPLSGEGQPPVREGGQPSDGGNGQPPGEAGQQPEGTAPADMQAPDGGWPAGGPNGRGGQGGMLELSLVNALIQRLQEKISGTAA